MYRGDFADPDHGHPGASGAMDHDGRRNRPGARRGDHASEATKGAFGEHAHHPGAVRSYPALGDWGRSYPGNQLAATQWASIAREVGAVSFSRRPRRPKRGGQLGARGTGRWLG